MNRRSFLQSLLFLPVAFVTPRAPAAKEEIIPIPRNQKEDELIAWLAAHERDFFVLAV